MLPNSQRCCPQQLLFLKKCFCLRPETRSLVNLKQSSNVMDSVKSESFFSYVIDNRKKKSPIKSVKKLLAINLLFGFIEVN